MRKGIFQKFKKGFGILLALAMIVTSVNLGTLTAHAADASGTCGDGITWTYNEATKTLTISGNGPMADYERQDDGSGYAPYMKVLGVKKVEYYKTYYIDDTKIEHLVIENGVTSIGNLALYRCHALKDVVIPESVTNIGEQAFMECTGLTSVTIPKSVTKIGGSAFQKCTGLTSVTIPKGVLSIEGYAFSYCSSLESAEIHARSIGSQAFLYCSSLKNVTLSSDVEEIKGSIFSDCPFTELVIPDSVTTIGGYLMQSCSNIEELTIPESVTSLSGAIIDWSSNLKKLHLKVNPKNCTTNPYVFTVHSNTQYEVEVSCKYLNDFKTLENWSNFAERYVAGHTQADSYETSENEHWKVCKDCGIEIENTRAAHKQADSYETSESQHWKVCKDCGTEIEDTCVAHTYGDWKVTKAATTTEEGIEERSCTVCGKKQTKAIDKLKEESSKEPEKETEKNPTNDSEEEPSAGTVKNDTNTKDNAFSGNLNETSEALADKVLTKEEKERIANGESVKVYLEVKDISDAVTKTDKEKVEAAKGDAELGMYLDLSLYKKIGNDDPKKVANTNGTVTIVIEVPTKLVNKDSGVTRTYQIVRVHNGKAEVINCKYDAEAGTITFETDKFSTYALVYKDAAKSTGTNTNTNTNSNSSGTAGNSSTGVVKPTSPKTGDSSTGVVKPTSPKTRDSSNLILWFALIVISGVAACYFVRKNTTVKKD